MEALPPFNVSTPNESASVPTVESFYANDDALFDELTSTIVRQVGALRTMVDEFSSFARMPQPKVERVEMGELVKSAVFTQRLVAHSYRIKADRESCY